MRWAAPRFTGLLHEYITGAFTPDFGQLGGEGRAEIFGHCSLQDHVAVGDPVVEEHVGLVGRDRAGGHAPLDLGGHVVPVRPQSPEPTEGLGPPCLVIHGSPHDRQSSTGYYPVRRD